MALAVWLPCEGAVYHVVACFVGLVVVAAKQGFVAGACVYNGIVCRRPCSARQGRTKGAIVIGGCHIELALNT